MTLHSTGVGVCYSYRQRHRTTSGLSRSFSSRVTHQSCSPTGAAFTLHEHPDALHETGPDVVVHERGAELRVVTTAVPERNSPICDQLSSHFKGNKRNLCGATHISVAKV